jgi:protein involved in polysaccharide export with SLBB domain
MTALQAIMLSGGVKNTGSQTQVLLYRKVNSEYAEVHPLNLRIRKTVELEQDMPLMPGDLILVRRSKVESVTRYTRIVGLNYNIVPQAY